MKNLKLLFIVILASQWISCRKEGLSKDTGNIEITIIYTNSYSLTLFTEAEYNNYITARPYKEFKNVYDDGFVSNKGGSTILSLKGIPGGTYMYRLWWWNDARTYSRLVEKSIIVKNKKTVKESYL